MNPIVVCQHIAKDYPSDGGVQSVLKDVNVSLYEGDMCVLLGPSGSGKTTLLSILGCLLSPTGGEMRIGNVPVAFSSSQQLLGIRRELMGFVFQHAQLLPFLNVEDNIRIAGANSENYNKTHPHIVHDLMERLGILELRKKKPAHLSGGERQRVSIARAVAKGPKILLADEPTASLDWDKGQVVMRLLLEQAKMQKAMLLTVTHDVRLVEMFERVFEIENGALVEK